MTSPTCVVESLEHFVALGKAVHEECFGHTIFSVLASVMLLQVRDGTANAQETADMMAISTNALRIYVSRYRIFFVTNPNGGGYTLTPEGLKAISKVFHRAAANKKGVEVLIG
jgi:hypothetical protein